MAVYKFFELRSVRYMTSIIANNFEKIVHEENNNYYLYHHKLKNFEEFVVSDYFPVTVECDWGQHRPSIWTQLHKEILSVACPAKFKEKKI